jgi:hypothetical protein
MTSTARHVALFLAFFGLVPACNPPAGPDGRPLMTLSRHNREKFPTLHGADENPTQRCNACHGGTDSFAEFDCLACHAHERQATEGAHAGVGGFKYDSVNCYACHPRGEAEGAANHPFPVGAGTPHEAATCGECHTTPGDYEVFSCTGCHDHAKPEMDATHKGVADYAYASKNCLACHPDGKGIDVGEHDKLFLISTGNHASAKCGDCHTGDGYATATCTGCHEPAAMDTTHAAMPGFTNAHDTTQCLVCHPQGRAYDRALHTQYPIATNSTHAATACGECHTTGDYNAYSCTGCHTQPPMATAHSGVPSYAWNSADCVACHPDGTVFTRAQHLPRFPVSSGAHAGFPCKDCHADGKNWKSFFCIACHTDNHLCAVMDGKHTSVNTYTCNDNACYACHPNGKH